MLGRTQKSQFKNTTKEEKNRKGKRSSMLTFTTGMEGSTENGGYGLKGGKWWWWLDDSRWRWCLGLPEMEVEAFGGRRWSGGRWRVVVCEKVVGCVVGDGE